jgi:hypothetical protein
MRPVSDSFLLNMAEVSSALIGLFLVGVLFYVESGFPRLEHTRGAVEPYFRASTRIVLVLFAIPLGLSLTLVALEPVWSRFLFVLLSLLLVAANVDTVVRIRALAKATGAASMLATELVGSLAVLVLVVLPWALGGLHPTREDLTWAILLSFAVGFMSICAMVMSVFDVARFEQAVRPRGDGG